MNVNSVVEIGGTRREGDVRPLPAHFHLQAFANSLSLLCVRRGGDDSWTTSFPAKLVLPALPPPQHTHSASEQGWALAVSLGSKSTGRRGPQEGEPEEARSLWRWARESQGDA